MTKLRDVVPPHSVGWVVFCQATDPATDPNNFVGPGKLWVETDDDTTPTVVVGMHIWSVDDSAWLDFPIGAAGTVADGDYGDIVVSGTGATWSFDSSVVTAAAKTVLDDASVSAMLATLGGAPLASPTFTGTPAAPTAAANTNTTQIATTAYVQGELTDLLGAVTSANDTLVEIENNLALKAPLASPTFTGTVTLPNDQALGGNPTTTTQSAGNSSTRIATTAFVAAAVTKAPTFIEYALSDETTAITTGLKFTTRAPYAFTLTNVRISLTTTSSSGNPAVDMKESGTTVFSTTPKIDAGELTNVTGTAAVISDSAIADDAELTFIVDTAGTGAKGLKIRLYVTPT